MANQTSKVHTANLNRKEIIESTFIQLVGIQSKFPSLYALDVYSKSEELEYLRNERKKENEKTIKIDSLVLTEKELRELNDIGYSDWFKKQDDRFVKHDYIKVDYLKKININPFVRKYSNRDVKCDYVKISKSNKDFMLCKTFKMLNGNSLYLNENNEQFFQPIAFNNIKANNIKEKKAILAYIKSSDQFFIYQDRKFVYCNQSSAFNYIEDDSFVNNVFENNKINLSLYFIPKANELTEYITKINSLYQKGSSLNLDKREEENFNKEVFENILKFKYTTKIGLDIFK